ncbi:DHH family phosphoesterase [Limisalsivibrio acetivorans]|uniref:DHH family phosphoesterase n=1 Tax=Limisalsivibrio acetivorans TaxID=1304888 RepID=UPI0003B52C1F|nr:DHHA1 domain-containing protein [Limisalsivibrio acetivorans]
MLLHITHNDLDGVGCGILVKKFLGDVQTAYCNYNDVDPTLDEAYGQVNSVLITDLAPSERMYMKAVGEVDITAIDHHPSSEWMKEHHSVIHDTTRSATLLTFEWLREQGYDVEPYRNFVDCVNDFDMWHMQRKDSLRMNVLFMKLGIDRFAKRFMDKPYQGFDDTEEMIISMEEDRRDRYIRNAAASGFQFTDKDGLKGFFVFCEEYNSELGNYITGEYNTDYVILMNAQKKKVSLRSRRGIDIGSLAVANGGGGHKNAAGFSTDFDFCVSEFLREIGVIDES